VPVFDFFAGEELVRPNVTTVEAERMASELFGITGVASELGSHQDRNFRIDVTTPLGVTSYLLKVDNSAFSEAELIAQDDALAHLSARGLRVPVPVAGMDGKTRQRWESDETSLAVRILSFVEGVPLATESTFSPATIAELGGLSARVARELADFDSAGLDRMLQWDLRRADKVIDRLIDNVADAGKRELLVTKSREALERLEKVFAGLRLQPIHGDITDDNVLGTARDSGVLPESVIDFGDLATSWLVAELAVTISSILHHVADPIDALLAVRAFTAVVPLNDDELAALWPLVVLRGAVLVVSGEYQVNIDDDNAYAHERTDHEWSIFESAARVDWDQALLAIRSQSDVSSVVEAQAAIFPSISEGDYELLDFSVTSAALNGGAWLDPDAEWSIALDALTRASIAIAPFGQCRLTRAVPNSREHTATLALGTELFLAAGATVYAPQEAKVTVLEYDRVGVTADGVELLVSGIAPALALGEPVEAGGVLGTVTDVRQGYGRVRIHTAIGSATGLPFFALPAERGRFSLALDPATLLGIDPVTDEFGAERELERRAVIFASAQERYYLDPPQIERGWKEFLIGVDGRVYLDMVNNVAAIGHSHPRQVKAVADQLALLNTNSRFLYRALADLSERLVDLAPDPSLDTVLLVNSGTEAVDLALRLAQVYTGRRTVIALREAYHGWSMGADAITTSAYDNPTALANRPDWVEVADIPNPYRGTYRGEDSASDYLSDLRIRLESMVAAGRLPAAFICESVLGNAGGVLMPDGYLAGAYELVRQHGGVTIADEVQVGYGRLGDYFWGVQQQGAVPDIISVAKAMGNGFPLGAVITRKDIAEALTREGNFFSSAGGSPASSVAGLAVLDIIRDEGLQQNAATVGRHLVSRIQELATRHPVIGAVHGMGLYLGVELVTDHATLEPATAETAEVCERLLDFGVIMQATSERQNVLKVKPPLCLSVSSADFFVDALDEVLAEIVTES
jgi:4-aminobutyrate aminotransferase-like enzyme/Ser/Thr protein kinase RdoA (MazF antagonist)